MIENVIATAGSGAYQPHHYRTARGDDVDLVLVRGGRPAIAVEVKRSTAPAISAGTHRAITDLGVSAAYIVHPDTDHQPYDSAGVTVAGITAFLERLRDDSL